MLCDLMLCSIVLTEKELIDLSFFIQLIKDDLISAKIRGSHK